MNPSYRKTVREVDVKKPMISRLKRIEGQVRGIQKMIDEDRYCVDVLIQINAVNAALKQVGYSILEDHASHCVIRAVESGDGEETVKELIDVLKQFSK